MQTAMLKPHGNHKLKVYNRYTHTHTKECKHKTKVCHQITREENKRGREEKGPTKINPKQVTKSNKNIHNNHLTCKWFKCSNQKTQTG